MRKKLTDMCTIQYGYAFDSKEFTDNSNFPQLVRIRDVKRGYSETFFRGKYSLEYIIHTGDLLIGMDGEFNIARWRSGDALLNQRVCKVTVKEDVDEEYLRFSLSRALKQIENRTSFVTVKHLSTKELNSLELECPNIQKQKEISDRLVKIEEIISLRQQQLAKLDELVKARFVEMFGDPMINSMHWPMCELSEYIQFLTSGSRGWAKYFTDEGEYFITIKNVKNCKITLDDVQHIAPPDNAEAKRTKVQAGDLLISITADLGRTGVVTQEIAEHGAYINQHLTCIRLNQSVVLPLYVAYYMESDAGKKQFQLKNQTGVKAGLNFNSINTLKVMVPPLEKQRSFVSFVEQVEKTKSSIQKNLKKIEILKKALVQRYFG